MKLLHVAAMRPHDSQCEFWTANLTLLEGVKRIDNSSLLETYTIDFISRDTIYEIRIRLLGSKTFCYVMRQLSINRTQDHGRGGAELIETLIY